MTRIVFGIHGGMDSNGGYNAGRTGATSLKYRVHHDGERRWLVPDSEAPADNIYVEDLNPDSSEGFGGATISFELANGDVLELKGPWQSNSESFFKATGIDIRDKHRTQGIVAVKREHLQGRTEYEDILHLDVVPVIGPYHRITDIAQRFADKRGEPVFYAFKSAGGGTSSRKDPTKQEAQFA